MNVSEHTSAALFRVNHHSFTGTDQTAWIEFATRTAQLAKNILCSSNADISLIELLQILAQERVKFALEQPGLAEGKARKFGQWRNDIYGVSADKAAISMRRRKRLNRALVDDGHAPLGFDINISICQTFYVKENPLFSGIIQNIIMCEQEDSENIIVQEVDQGAREVISNLIKTKINIKPLSFFDKVEYKKYTLIHKNETANIFTRFYIVGNLEAAFFVLIEHPRANLVCSLLKAEVNDAFQALFKLKNNKILFLEMLGTFLWYCHQLMPFERGSASIFLMLTSAMLQSADIQPKCYPGNRLDIDALSLTKDLFTQKIIHAFS
jgi:hypothetical protein